MWIIDDRDNKAYNIDKNIEIEVNISTIKINFSNISCKIETYRYINIILATKFAEYLINLKEPFVLTRQINTIFKKWMENKC